MIKPTISPTQIQLNLRVGVEAYPLTIVLALATLGDVTQIEMILSIPRCPRQVKSHVAVAVADKCRQCK